MDKLTIKLIKQNNKVKYSVLEQSESLRSKNFYHVIFFDSGSFAFMSCNFPTLVMSPNTFFVKGGYKDLDNSVSYHPMVESFFALITRPNVDKIKKYFFKIGIEFNLITNLYKKELDSEF